MLLSATGRPTATRGARARGAAVLLTFFLRRRPKPAGAIARGFAAYSYRSGLGLGTKAVFRALRQEWLDRLVAAHPEVADDADYQQRTGKEKPVAEKPF